MSYSVYLKSEAEEDILESIAWYNEKYSGLGNKFWKSVENSINKIADSPEKYPTIYKNIRRLLIKKYPFGVYFLIDGNKIIILAVLHIKRNPDELKKRSK